ncbi:MAG: glycosyltransferase family 4 protein [Prevotellaceae bacterium]|nr:glycosyltransferase family 4 protein [Prevotellaceae bacterium]
MKIGFDAKRLYNNFTGLGNHSRTTIDILTANFPENEYYLYTPKVKQNDVTLPYLQLKGCHTVQPHGLLRGSAWRTFGMASDVKHDGIELFHGLSNEMPVGLFHSGIPTVVTIHDVAFRTFTDMYHWHDRQIYDIKWRYACNHADRIIAISEGTKKDVIKFYGVPEHKVDIVYQPVNPRYYTPIERSHTSPYMLYVGSVNSRKNLLGIVKAMELMPKDLQIPLKVVGGGGAYKKTVREYIATHNMEHLFEWTETIDNAELQRLYTNAQLMAYPSFYEGFGLPIVEAQLCGCPVVTSNVSCLPEIGGPYAMKADPNSPEDICNQMIKLLTDDAFRQVQSEGGRQRAMQTFHPTVLAKQLMSIYNKCV